QLVVVEVVAPQLLVIVGARRRDRRLPVSGGLGRDVAVVRGGLEPAVARPPADAVDLVRVRLALDDVSRQRLGRAAAREPARRQIEGAPEELHRARLADEPSLELLE